MYQVAQPNAFHPAETADSPRDDHDRVMAIDLRGVWSCMKFELRQMRKHGSGATVNCSSLSGLVGGAHLIRIRPREKQCVLFKNYTFTQQASTD